MSTVVVPSQDQLEQAVMSYVAQGFVVSTQTPDTTTMFKKKEFNVVWAVIGFFACVLPLIVYCIVYAAQSDKMVVIRVDPNVPASAALPFVTPAVVAAPANDELTWSEDRTYWWDGSTWINATATIPPGASVNDERGEWWDGVSWRPMPTN
jgi:hypothetical protein